MSLPVYFHPSLAIKESKKHLFLEIEGEDGYIFSLAKDIALAHYVVIDSAATYSRLNLTSSQRAVKLEWVDECIKRSAYVVPSKRFSTFADEGAILDKKVPSNLDDYFSTDGGQDDLEKNDTEVDMRKIDTKKAPAKPKKSASASTPKATASNSANLTPSAKLTAPAEASSPNLKKSIKQKASNAANDAMDISPSISSKKKPDQTNGQTATTASTPAVTKSKRNLPSHKGLKRKSTDPVPYVEPPPAKKAKRAKQNSELTHIYFSRASKEDRNTYTKAIQNRWPDNAAVVTNIDQAQYVVTFANERTTSILVAIAKGLPVLRKAWLDEGINSPSMQFPAPSKFICTDWPGCERGRNAHKLVKAYNASHSSSEGDTDVEIPTLLLEGLSFNIDHLKADKMVAEAVPRIIKHAGGIIKTYNKADCIILVNPDTYYREISVIIDHQLQTKKVTVLNYEWLLDSIAEWSLLPYDEYYVEAQKPL